MPHQALPQTGLIISPLDFHQNTSDILSTPHPSEITTASTTPGGRHTPVYGSPFFEFSTSPEKPLRCLVDGCDKAFAKPCQLKQHNKRHTRPETCPHCPKDASGNPRRFADKKGLNRHISTKHGEVAGTDMKTSKTDQRKCPFPRFNCPYIGREDNVSRHYQKVHREKLRWKRGRPFVELDR